MKTETEEVSKPQFSARVKCIRIPQGWLEKGPLQIVTGYPPGTMKCHPGDRVLPSTHPACHYILYDAKQVLLLMAVENHWWPEMIRDRKPLLWSKAKVCRGSHLTEGSTAPTSIPTLSQDSIINSSHFSPMNVLQYSCTWYAIFQIQYFTN